jgi:hypothetical protein
MSMALETMLKAVFKYSWAAALLALASRAGRSACPLLLIHHVHLRLAGAASMRGRCLGGEGGQGRESCLDFLDGDVPDAG